MIPELGLFALILGFLCSGFLWSLPGIQRLLSLPGMTTVSLGQSLLYGQWLGVTIGFLLLLFCFASSDFSVAYVAEHSHTHLPFFYRCAALWGGHEGSLLLWVFLLSCWACAFSWHARRFPLSVRMISLSVLGGLLVGFLLILLETAHPYHRWLPYFPQEGNDLNPLLQDPGFFIHPPFLYMGYVGFAIPFVLSIVTLFSKEAQESFAHWAKPWALLAVSLLSLGIVLGSIWSYYELGWGGYWFWDPVENASLMLWLVGVALVHSLYVSHRRPQYRFWAQAFAIAAFAFSLLGTFLVRSGVLSSVHAFATDPKRGSALLLFLTLVLSVGFVSFRRRASREKREPAHTASLIAKESLILLGCALLLVGTGIVLLGTMYPLFAEKFLKQPLSVGAPYFQKTFLPLMALVLGLMGIAPYLQWQEQSATLFWKRIKKSIYTLLGLLLLFYCLALFCDPLSLGALLGSSLSLWVIGLLLWKTAVRFLEKKGSGISWGWRLAHWGVATLALGGLLVSLLGKERELLLPLGGEAQLGGYAIEWQSLGDISGPNYVGKRAHFEIKKGQRVVAELFPEKRFFTTRRVAMTETAIQSYRLQDFYIALGEPLGDDTWSVRVAVKPFIRLLWLGGFLIALGAFLSALSAFRKQ